MRKDTKLSPLFYTASDGKPERGLGTKITELSDRELSGKEVTYLHTHSLLICADVMCS